jgi:hypothetical protein
VSSLKDRNLRKRGGGRKGARGEETEREQVNEGERERNLKIE